MESRADKLRSDAAFDANAEYRATRDRCETCSAWSQLLAHASGGSPVKAACLNPASPRYLNNPGNLVQARWPTGRETCRNWSDDPDLSDLR